MKRQLAEAVSWSARCSEDLSNALIPADNQCSRLLKPTIAVVVPNGAYSRLEVDRKARFDVTDLDAAYAESLVVVNGPDHTNGGEKSVPDQPLTITVAAATCDTGSGGLVPANVAECRFDTPKDGRISILVSGPVKDDPIQVSVTLRRFRMQ